MTTEKTKAALDAFDRLISDVIPMARHPDNVKSDVDAVRAALTAQAEAQPADDEVREALECLNKAKGYIKREMLAATLDEVEKAESAIRAATAPKTTDAEKRSGLEFGYHIMGQTFFAGWRKQGEPCLYDVWFTIDLTDICPKALQKHIDRVNAIKTALRAPAAVPQEVVDKLKKIASDWSHDCGVVEPMYVTEAETSGEYDVAIKRFIMDGRTNYTPKEVLQSVMNLKAHKARSESRRKLANEALALLGGKEG